MAKQKRLGKGIEALFANSDFNVLNDEIEDIQGYDIVEVEIEKLRPNPYQPRKSFDQNALEELASSIKEHGIFQPIIVRENLVGYDILAGERRYRASQLIGLETIPAIIKEFNDQEMMEIALLENLQREDLSAIEEAQAYQMLIDQLNLTQEQLGKRLGKSRSHITNTLRLLTLPQYVQDAIINNELSMGHAKILVGKSEKDIKNLFNQIVEDELSVRQTEELIYGTNPQKKTSIKSKSKKEAKSNQIIYLEKKLAENLGTKSIINYSNGKGKIELSFSNDEDLNRILELLGIIE
ncbi:ParB/RepB/Spo0J family partition protein [Culicoidibacter larvae]|uniref:ParB/RepB/Spo0J family partition protein n=1 Tax=Culicoidibacter larvae TaxID=2579976 RepID=A0A5R8QHA7_9FIRM|nr:ParB/RepB/Spo0J family partition protein [Culicoidibacter larvae]TLG77164.1 ParB/RepB/Spo0J family partition protein [Culicoidibacter larvae]